MRWSRNAGQSAGSSPLAERALRHSSSCAWMFGLSTAMSARLAMGSSSFLRPRGAQPGGSCAPVPALRPLRVRGLVVLTDEVVRRPAARIWRAERRHMRLERAPVQGVLAPLGPQLAPLVVLSADVRVVGGHVGKSCHATSYSPTHAVGPCN